MILEKDALIQKRIFANKYNLFSVNQSCFSFYQLFI